MARLAFVLSAAAAAFALRLAWEAPIAGIVGLAFLGTVVLARWLARRRARALLRSGDVESILQRWSSSLERVPHPETMGPLMTATAFAAHGWLERARDVLRKAERGPAWDAAIEHRLFVDALLCTFEGNSEEAMQKAGALQRLPLPSAAPFLVERVRVLRNAMAALARAFSHTASAGDAQLLMAASDVSPLVHWAMRYGAAIASVDAGDLGRARALLIGAPSWPSESCFYTFHREISDEVDRRLDPEPATIVDVPAETTANESPAHGEPPDAGAAAGVVDEEDRSDGGVGSGQR
jgi:hypothetical protein